MKVKITLNKAELEELLKEKFGKISNFSYNLDEVGDDRFGSTSKEFTAVEFQVEDFQTKPQVNYRNSLPNVQ